MIQKVYDYPWLLKPILFETRMYVSFPEFSFFLFYTDPRIDAIAAQLQRLSGVCFLKVRCRTSYEAPELRSFIKHSATTTVN